MEHRMSGPTATIRPSVMATSATKAVVCPVPSTTRPFRTTMSQVGMPSGASSSEGANFNRPRGRRLASVPRGVFELFRSLEFKSSRRKPPKT